MKVNNNIGWKQEMDALVKRTSKNWENTGKNKKSSGISGSLNLGKKALLA